MLPELSPNAANQLLLLLPRPTFDLYFPLARRGLIRKWRRRIEQPQCSLVISKLRPLRAIVFVDAATRIGSDTSIVSASWSLSYVDEPYHSG